MRKYRFFFHYNKQNNKMTVHFRKQCYIVKDILCTTDCVTRWRKNQPRVVMEGFTEDVIIKNDIAYIE